MKRKIGNSWGVGGYTWPLWNGNSEEVGGSNRKNHPGKGYGHFLESHNVNLFMSHTIWWDVKALVTIPALIWFFSCVGNFMPLTRWWFYKAFFTILALITFHSCVYQFMLLTIWWVGKTLITILALIRLHSCVCAFMLLAIWWLIKTFITILALVRSYSCMHQFMPLAIWQLTKTLITVLALVRFYSCVSKFMPFTIRWSFKALITILALMRFHSRVNYFTSLEMWWICILALTHCGLTSESALVCWINCSLLLVDFSFFHGFNAICTCMIVKFLSFAMYKDCGFIVFTCCKTPKKISFHKSSLPIKTESKSFTLCHSQ